MPHAQNHCVPTGLPGEDTPFYRIARAMLAERSRRVIGGQPFPWGTDADSVRHVARLLTVAASDD